MDMIIFQLSKTIVKLYPQNSIHFISLFQFQFQLKKIILNQSIFVGVNMIMKSIIVNLLFVCKKNYFSELLVRHNLKTLYIYP